MCRAGIISGRKLERCEFRSIALDAESGSPPPNKALELTPNSLAQSIRGSVLAASVGAMALAVSAVGPQLSAQFVGRREASVE